jgi:hypothetical protein
VRSGHTHDLKHIFKALCLAQDSMRSLPGVCEHRSAELAVYKRLAEEALKQLIDTEQSLNIINTEKGE